MEGELFAFGSTATLMSTEGRRSRHRGGEIAWQRPYGGGGGGKR